MKRYIQINISRYQRLFEGKKQAMQILERDLTSLEAKIVIKELIEYDLTSPKNKYVEAFARMFLQVLNAKGLSTTPKKRASEIGDTLYVFDRAFIDKNIKENLKHIEKQRLRINLSKIKTFSDMETEIERILNTRSKPAMQKALKKLKRGKDYIEVPISHPDWNAYIPLNYDAGILIASKQVGKILGDWCTSYTNNRDHWRDYIEDNHGVLVYAVYYGKDVAYKDYTNILNNKQATYFYGENRKEYEFSSFDANDNLIKLTDTYFINEIKQFTKKNWKEILSKTEMPEKIVWQDGTWDSGIWQDGLWKSGIWKDGLWDRGTWESGTWYNGTWKKGVWEDGTWINGRHVSGEWKKGIWQDGTWDNGVWKNGTWEGGTWSDGIWQGGIWQRGVWYTGTWENGVWYTGVWYWGKWGNGEWKDGIWHEGEWWTGTWENGTWKNGTWNRGIWKNGGWQRGIWRTGTWENGTWQNGDWFKGRWENGTWIRGKWHNGTWIDGIWENGTWKDGVFNNGTWKNGVWMKGSWQNGTWVRGLIHSKKFDKLIGSSVNPNEFKVLELKYDDEAEFIDALAEEK